MFSYIVRRLSTTRQCAQRQQQLIALINRPVTYFEDKYSVDFDICIKLA